ncbi:MAG: hypothetical protein EBY28_11760 [Betaproteobacteria bacterium]|nr:hypothetical protein [Betaproteobacteria bacterium]
MLAIDRLALASPGDVQPRPHDNCYWLLPGRVMAGEYPGLADPQQQSRRLEAMVGAGVCVVVDLTDPSEGLPPYVDALRATAQGAAIQCQRFPIKDFSVPEAKTMRRILDAVDAALAAGDTVYLHCHGGIGRTGTVVGCWLVERGFTSAQALALIAAKWRVMAKRHRSPESPETAEQREFIAAWASGLAPSL